MNGYAWELYNLADDPTQVNDLAKAQPASSRHEGALHHGGQQNQVFPLNSSITAMVAPRPGPAAGRKQFVYTGPSCCTQANAAPEHSQPLLQDYGGHRPCRPAEAMACWLPRAAASLGGAFT